MMKEAQLQNYFMNKMGCIPCLEAARIGVSAAGRDLMLIGTIATQAQKWLVGVVALGVRRVMGLADTSLVKNKKLQARADMDLAQAARGSLERDAWTPRGIQASVAQGWVTLNGYATWEFERTAARG